MPLYKYVANRFLTAVQNLLMGAKLSEYHTGFRAYSRHALSHGLSPRVESGGSGRAVPGLEDALRVFEIHEGQVGVACFVNDLLACLFVVPHPDDYRHLHRTLLEDFFGEEKTRFGNIICDAF